MITIRPADDRGHADQGWLNSRFTFSFASYNDPVYMGFRALRVINEDRIAPGKGFGAHAHRDMEIVTYVLEGSLAHKDSMGERHIIEPNTIQAMSAGTGVVHSEFNPSESQPVHLLQVWIEPAMEDVTPSYRQISFEPAEKRGRLKLIAGPHESRSEASAVIHQDASIYASELAKGETLSRALVPGRFAWVQVARGSMLLNGQELAEGDGAAVGDERELSFCGDGPDGAEFLFFDLA
jgi:redox-sensitive bicupin YhaK (pirin superfamily)